MLQDVVKSLLINAAYVGAVAVCEETQGGGVPVDPLIKDTGLQGKGVMVYEEAKVQYAVLLQAFQDKTGIWPDPKVSGLDLSSLSGLASLVPELAPLLSALPAGSTVSDLAGLVTKLLGAAKPAAAPAPSPTIPLK